MLRSSPPRSFPIRFAEAAAGAFVRDIPVASQIGVEAGAASLTTGFVPLNFQPVAAGGIPPFGQDVNGIVKQLSAWAQWGEAGAPIFYDAAFATGSGGYPQGAVVRSSISFTARWMSLTDNNTDDPDALGQTSWAPDPSMIAPGTPVASFASTVPAGYVAANSNTVGNSGSGAVAADPVFLLLYRSIWLNFSNAVCPIYTSGGVPTTRGANPDADFAALKALATPDMRGRGLTGVDVMNGPVTARLAGVPFTLGNSTTTGSILGENLHPLTAGENATHSHANALIDPGHVHANSLTDPGHTHINTLSDPGHTHINTLSDPGHVHANSLTDPGHVHPLVNPNNLNGWTNTVAGAVGFTTGTGTLRQVNTPDLTIGSSFTGLSINNASVGTGLSINNASRVTGMSINNASVGTGLSINNASVGTGMSISNVNSGSGTGHNNVASGITVFWNLKT